MKRLCVAAMFSALTAGCAYTESSFGDLLDEQTFGGLGISRAGFSETPLASDAYRIHAFGNKNASLEKTNAVALVRAAVLAQEHGYDRFVILGYDEWTETSYRTTPTTATTDTSTTARFNAYGTGYDVGSYRYTDISGRVNAQSTSTTTIHHGQTYAVNKPKTDFVVLFVPSNAPEAARALRVADVIARYGKMAGYKPKKAASPVQAASMTPAQPAPAAPVRAASAVAGVEAPSDYVAPVEPARIASPVQYDPALPTLDEIYKSLSAGEKARVNRLPPAQRAAYLEKIRERSF